MHTAVLQDLLGAEGPYASVYFDGSHDTEDAGKEIDLRWRAVRERLTEADAEKRTVLALDEAIRSGAPAVGQAGRFLIAAGDTVLIDEYLPDPPPNPVVRVSTLPYVVPLAIAERPRVPHVVVLVDKIGADLRAVDADGKVLAEYPVEGRDHPVHKVGGGGWSHRNIQKHTEETIKHNIAQVAVETTQLVQRTGARLLVLAGETEPRTLLRRAIPPACEQIAAEVDSGRRGRGGNREEFQRDVAEVVARHWRADREALLDRFRAALHRGDGLAVQGLRPTTEALREANVEALVISEAAMGDRTVWTGSRPHLVAVDQSELDSYGSPGRTRDRADEALPAAAIAVGAELVAGDERLGDGVGALLRHD